MFVVALLILFINKKNQRRCNVTGPPGALVFNVKPEIALKESLELQFCSTCHLGHLLHSFPVILVIFVKHSMQFVAQRY